MARKCLAQLLVLFVGAPPLFFSLGARGSGPAVAHYRGSHASMGTTYRIQLYGAGREDLALVAESAFDEVDRIDRLMSVYKRNSAVSFINRRAGREPVRVEPELFDFLQRCLAFSRQSRGAFDVTVQPLMRAWGFFGGQGRLPPEIELREALQRVGYRKLSLDPGRRTVRFDQDGMALDLGGIAKGYAVDRVVSLLREYRIASALVSAGGSTVFGFGAPPGKTAWTVKVRDPAFPRDPQRSALTVTLENQCLSVSGSYENSFSFEGVTYSHIMDPRSGRPVQGLLSVAVVAGSGMEGDALDNALFVIGPEKAQGYLKQYPRVQAYYFLPQEEEGWKMLSVPRARVAESFD
ncbi:MAG: FAD:protein FMN transferase [Acidobacteriota bacterium]|nr:FAD:protein FMN transferase [Acidobacteriota bacterium]MDE2962505.1 FAD:protein FMN transferase [Acidobacteriota bacterium]